MHNNDIGNILEFVWKRFKTSQIATNQKEVEIKKRFALFHCCIGHYLRASWAGLKLFGREIEVYIFSCLLNV